MAKRIIRLSRPLFLIREEDIAVFMYKIRNKDYRESLEGVDIVLDGTCIVSSPLDKEFLTIVNKGDDLGVNFIIIGDAVTYKPDKRIERGAEPDIYPNPNLQP